MQLPGEQWHYLGNNAEKVCVGDVLSNTFQPLVVEHADGAQLATEEMALPGVPKPHQSVGPSDVIHWPREMRF